MKKILLILALTLALTVTAFADSVTTVQVLGIMTGDEQGNMNLSSPVTRAEFSKMLVASSSEKDNHQPPSSVFKDLKSNHWASGYVKLAVDNGWIFGYTDGTFRPNNEILAHEAYAMGLRIMGYSTENLKGDFKSAVLNLAEKTGLNDGITNTGVMLRSDCAILFENILCGNTPSGMAYGTTLGYTVMDGKLDLNSVITKDREGPYVYHNNWTYGEPATVYLNDKVASLDSLQENDVYYYNSATRVVYGYREKAYGTITAISGGAMTPTAVTVQGISYPLTTNTAKVRISGGTVAEGQMVTLLLDEKNQVVDILDSVSSMATYYGLVTGEALSELGEKLTVLCTDGTTRVFDVKTTAYDVDDVVEVTVGNPNTVKKASTTNLSGKITSTKIGTSTVADNLEILEVANGKAMPVYLSRLQGYTLKSGDVLCYEKNEDGEISRLMLDNATGDLATYGYLTKKETVNTQIQLIGMYEVVVRGNTMPIQTQNILYPVDKGGVFLEYTSQNTLETMGTLTGYDLDTVSGLLAKDGSKTLAIGEGVDVMLKVKDGYLASTLADAESGNYDMTGYADKYSLGQKIRVIILESK